MKEKENRYAGCELEFEDSGIVAIVCENADKKKDLVALIAGTQVENGICVLGDFDTGNHLEEYKKRVDIIDPERIDSTLNVKNYLIFFTMVTGIYRENTVDELTRLFARNGIEDLLNKPVNDLSKAEKIKIRCLASHLKQVDCLIGKDLLQDLEVKQQECLILFLKEYFGEKQCLCLLAESAVLQEINVDKVLKI